MTTVSRAPETAPSAPSICHYLPWSITCPLWCGSDAFGNGNPLTLLLHCSMPLHHLPHRQLNYIAPRTTLFLLFSSFPSFLSGALAWPLQRMLCYPMKVLAPFLPIHHPLLSNDGVQEILTIIRQLASMGCQYCYWNAWRTTTCLFKPGQFYIHYIDNGASCHNPASRIVPRSYDNPGSVLLQDPDNGSRDPFVDFLVILVFTRPGFHSLRVEFRFSITSTGPMPVRLFSIGFEKRRPSSKYLYASAA